MEEVKKFKTKSGFCHILPDKIILTKHESLKNIEALSTKGNRIIWLLLIYGAASLLMFYLAIQNYRNEDYPVFIYLGLIGLFLIYGIVVSFRNSTIPVIDRGRIKEIKFKQIFLGLAGPRFEVFFADENGKIRRRIIMLPDSIKNGKVEK